MSSVNLHKPRLKFYYLRRGLELSVAALLTALLVLNWLWPLPEQPPGRGFATLVVDKDGRPLRAFADAQGVWRYPARNEEISARYFEALIAYEDRWFYMHPGVNPLALARAALSNLRHGRVVSGGSTLSMQVARILYPHSRDMLGKTAQVLRALQLEWRYSKAEILNLYVNYAPFGGNIEGVQAASFSYLRKSARDLSHADAALLAVLPQRPSKLRPDRHPEAARRARDKVIARVVSHKVWPASVLADAGAEPVVPFRRQMPFIAPHLSQSLQAQTPEQALIVTTLDGELQQRMEEFALDEVSRLPAQASLAIVAAELDTGAVRAYIGNADFNDNLRAGQVDLARALRSPGSTLKPFLYGMALDDGIVHAQSLLSDAPLMFGAYRPGNFYGGFAGPVSLTEALQRSLNLPAVQVLQALGPRTFFARLHNAGVQVQLPAGTEPELPLILGGGGARLTELVGAYAAFGRDGKALRLRTRADEAVQERALLTPQSAYVIHEILREVARPSGYLDSHPLLQRRRAPLAYKTGTSYGFRDAWAIGVGARFVIGVWVGRADGSPLPGEFGLQTAAPILFAAYAQLDEPALMALARPAGVSEAVICWPLGLARTQTSAEACHRERRALVVNGALPPTLSEPGDNAQSNPVQVRIDANTRQLVNDDCPGTEAVSKTIALWPRALEAFLPASLRRQTLLPKTDARCAQTVAAGHAALSIVGLRDGAHLRAIAGDRTLPRISLQANGGQGSLRWYVNGVAVAQTRAGAGSLYRFKTQGRQQIVVVDEVGRSAQVNLSIDAEQASGS